MDMALSMVDGAAHDVGRRTTRKHIHINPQTRQHTYTCERVNQSIKGPHKVKRGQQRSHIPSPPPGAADPASRSDAGLGGCERAATELVCETLVFTVLV